MADHRRSRPLAELRTYHRVPSQLPFQHSDLMAQRQDLGILIPVAHLKEPQ
jgi:hypothetical protein